MGYLESEIRLKTTNKLVTALSVAEDRDMSCALARVVHEEGMFSDIKFSEKKFYRYFEQTIENPETHLGLKVSLGNRILGFSFCSIGSYFIGDGARIVTVTTICIDKETRSSILGGKVALRLVRGIELWSRQRKADAILYHVTSGVDVANIDRVFRKLGMITLGGNYAVRLS